MKNMQLQSLSHLAFASVTRTTRRLAVSIAIATALAGAGRCDEPGFASRAWRGETAYVRLPEGVANGLVPFAGRDLDGVKLSLLSPDGDEGYPGNLHVSVTYSLTVDNGLSVSYEAFTDRDTVINLTNHCYFNPNGVDLSFTRNRQPDECDNRDVELTVGADRIVETDGEIPTGLLLPVEGTVFDFRTPRRLGGAAASIAGEPFGGYDHTFVLSPHAPEQPVASALGVKSGIRIECFTDQPAAQLFTMGEPGSAFAFETQHFPDSPHHPDFPSTLLRAGEVFRSQTVYRFSQE